MVRFKPNRFSITPNTHEDYIKYIDTSVFYVAIQSKENIEKYNLENFQNGIKFYSEGRIGHFKGINFNKAEQFDPKKASMGYYNYDGTIFYIEGISPVPSLVGSKYLLSKSKILIEQSSNDTLILKNFKSAGGGGYTIKYVKRKIPKEALNYKPDW